MKKIVTLSVLLLLVLIYVLSMGSKKGGLLEVKTIPVEQGAISSTVRATGKVVSAREAQMGASVAGQIVNVFIKVGQVVDKGALLLQLDEQEALIRMRKARTAIQEAREKMQREKRTAHGLRQVWKAGGISYQELQDSETKVQLAHADEKRAESELHSAQIAHDKLKVFAPFAGLVTKNLAHIGEWAVPGAPLVTVADQENLEIHAFVDDADAALISVGQHVDVSSDAVQGKSWVEQVVRIAPLIEKGGTANTITVHISFNRDIDKLRIGQQLDAKIRTTHKEKAVKLLFEAVIKQEGKPVVAVVRDEHVHMIPVITGIEDMTHIEILKGVEAGQYVILPEAKELQEGQRIRVIQNSVFYHKIN